MAQRRYSIGTTPDLIANHNPKRASLVITMLPSAIESGNTGRVHVGKGFPPSATLGAPNQGDPLVQGGQIQESSQFRGDPSFYKGQWWAIASATGQIITVDDMIEADIFGEEVK